MEFAADWLHSCRQLCGQEHDTVGWIVKQLPLSQLVAQAYGLPAGQPPVKRRGRKPHNRLAMTVALLYMQTEHIPYLADLAKRLHDDDDFAQRCGFATHEKRPQRWDLSRHFWRLAGWDFAAHLQWALVQAAMGLGLVSGAGVAIDSTEITGHEAASSEPKPTAGMSPSQRRRWEEKQAQQRLQEAHSLSFHEQVAKLPTAADWGRKRDSKGHMHDWFGYKLHLAVDTGPYEIPLLAVLTSASCHDLRAAYPLVRGLRERWPQLQPRHWVYDSAYDAKDLYGYHAAYGQQMIAELNWRTAQPPAGFDQRMHPVCEAGQSHRYHSYDGKYHTLRFRAPQECEPATCPYSAQCRGRERKVKVRDLRLHAPPARGSQVFARLYDRRTVVERTIDGLKVDHQGNACFLKGHAKVQLWAGLALACWTARKIVLGLQGRQRGRPRRRRAQRALPKQLRLDRHGGFLAR